MSDPRRYHAYASGAGSGSSNYARSTYSTLIDAGMSYPTTNQSNPQPGQMYPPTSSGRGSSTAHPSSQAYQQSYAAQPYGMTGPPISPDSPLNNYNFNAGGPQYPNTPYNPNGAYPPSNTQWAGSQAAQAQPSWNDMSYASPTAPSSASPYGSSANNYPHGMPAPAVYPNSQYAPSSSSARGPDPSFGIKQCYHCHATTTPLWRRDPTTHHTLCNACGLYLQQRHAQRPQELIDADNDEESEGSVGAPDGPECSHCHTRQTSVWRRNKDGDQVCNACGVYQRLRGKERPLSLKRNKIKPRAKHSQT